MALRLAGTGCLGIEPAAIDSINSFLAAFPKTSGRVQSLIDRRDAELVDAISTIEQWTSQYAGLVRHGREIF